MALSTNESPLFDGTNYSSWREIMKRYMKSIGSGVWDLVVSKPWYSTTSKNKSKTTKEDKAEEIKRLKTEVANLTEEMEELKTRDNKIK